MFPLLRTTLSFGVILFFSVLFSLTSRAEIPAADGEGPIPVIDIHTHVFNAHDLPLAGVFSALGVPDGVARSLAKVINRWTSPDDLNKPPTPLKLFTADIVALHSTVATKNGLSDILTPDERKELADYAGVVQATPPATSPSNILKPPGIAPGTAAILPQFKSLTQKSDPDEDIGTVAAALRKANFPPTENPSAPQPTPRFSSESAAFIGMDLFSSPSLKGYIDFIGIMRKGNVAIAQTLMTEYKHVDLFTHHMMDMSKAYNDVPVVPFDQQMTRMTKLDQRFPGQFIHFVAFDPFRRNDSLNFVVKGINAGAVGVKFYPPSGYSAANNDIQPEAAGASASAQQRWNSRYQGLDNKAIDDLNDALFTYCESKNIPIFTHCTPGGFEAEKGYGTKADPALWEPVLAKHKQLRVCFGHSGGDDFWFNDPSLSGTQSYAFGKKVVELCRNYPNVYCEVGYMEQILASHGSKEFAADLGALLREPVEPGKYSLADKIMYGTDWHMIYKEQNHALYFDDFVNVFSDPNLKDYRRRFFSGNAMNYLNLAKLRTDPRFSKQQQDYWKALIAKNASGASSPTPGSQSKEKPSD